MENGRSGWGDFDSFQLVHPLFKISAKIKIIFARRGRTIEKDDRRLFPVLVYTRRSVTSRRRYLVTGSDGLENPVGGEGIVESVSRMGRR